MKRKHFILALAAMLLSFAPPIFAQNVAKVGDTEYATLADAVKAASAGQTITLVADATENSTVVLTKNLTIDGAHHTFTGAIELDKSNATYTIKNMNFNGAGTRVYALKSTTSATKLTVENCTATGYTYGFLYANKAVANAIVNNVTVKDVNYGVHSAYGTNVTLNNFVAENVEYGVMVQNYGKRNVVLNNCTFTDCATPLYVWERNQTNKITFNFKGINEMGKADFCASAMAVVNADAVVGTKVCGTLAAAVEAAETGATVTLINNVQLDSYLTINKSITLDLGEYNITRNDGTALYVDGDVEVAINGTTGTVTGKQALYVADGLVKVNGGNFHGAYEAVYVQNTGKVEIYGGNFSSSSEPNSFLLNEYDATRETSSITVYGGTFVGFNPADNAAEGAGTNFVAEGCVVTENEGTFSVVYNPAEGKVAQIGENYYATLAEAIEAAKAGETITLIDDVNQTVTISKSVTIDGAGKQYTGTMNANNGLTVTVQNVNFVNAGFAKNNSGTTGTYTLKNCTFDGQGTYAYPVLVNNIGTLNVENCTVKNYQYSFLYVKKQSTKVTVKNVTVEDCPSYAVYFASGVTTATIEGLKVKNSNNGLIINNAGARKLTLKDCTMENVATAINHTGGTYTITVTAQGENDFGGAAISPYVKINGTINNIGSPVAKVGDTEYNSLSEAFAAAQNGETVTLIADVELGWDDVVKNNSGQAVLANVDGKSINFDMNGKKITVVHRSATDRIFAVICVEDGASLTVTGNGTIDVVTGHTTTMPKVAYMFWKRGTTGTLVIENGNFHMDNAEDSMVYTNGDNIVTVNGGTFVLDAIGTRADADYFPWIFNTNGRNQQSINVNGGKYNFDVRKQYYENEVKLAEGKTMIQDADGLWTVAVAEAAIEGVGYTSLAEAVEAAEAGATVTLLADATGAGVVINKSITIDFNGKTYTVNKAVGSAGTETLGFQILKDNYVTLTSGTLTSTAAVEGSNEVKMLVQNYANLTVEDMNLVDATGLLQYVLSNNSGTVSIEGATNITATEGNVAFDACKYANYAIPTVTVETTGMIAGKVEVTGGNLAIKSGTFTAEIQPEWCADYYVPVQNADGTWTVDYRYEETKTIVDDDYTPFENLVEKTIGELTYKRTIPTADVWQSIYVPFEIPVEELTKLGYDVAYYLDVHFEVVNGKINMDEAPEVHLILINEGTLKANFPYAIRAKSSKNAKLDLELVLENAKLYSTAAENMNSVESGSTVNRFVFAGTYTRSIPSALTGNNTTPCYAVTKKGEFKKMGATAGLPPFRVYMSIIAKDGSPFISSGAPAESIRMRVIGEESEDETTGIKFYEFDNEQTSDYIYDLHGRRVMEPQKGSIYIVNGKKIVF